MKVRTRQNILLILLTILIAFSMIWINAYRRSVKYYKSGEAYLAAGKLMEAISSFETAAHAYTPMNANISQSMQRLWEIGDKLESEKNDIHGALIAYRCLRSSVYAIRSLYSPYKEWIPRCDEQIARLVEIQKATAEKSSP